MTLTLLAMTTWGASQIQSSSSSTDRGERVDVCAEVRGELEKSTATLVFMGVGADGGARLGGGGGGGGEDTDFIAASKFVAEAANSSPGEYRFLIVIISQAFSCPTELVSHEFFRTGGECENVGVEGEAGDDGVGVRPSPSDSSDVIFGG